MRFIAALAFVLVMSSAWAHQPPKHNHPGQMSRQTGNSKIEVNPGLKLPEKRVQTPAASRTRPGSSSHHMGSTGRGKGQTSFQSGKAAAQPLGNSAMDRLQGM